MCLIFFAVNAHPNYSLLVAANRDEFFQRPTLPLHAWENSPVIAGKDLTGGGTWMGITREGRFAAITNYRDPKDSVADPLSRGLLVREFLESQQSAPDYLNAVAEQSHRYPGFNLVAGRHADLWYYSNRANKGPEKLTAGIHGLSNHLMDTPWPKVADGKQELQQLLASSGDMSNDTLADTLFSLLTHRQPALDNKLPDTGVGLAFERELSPRFIHAPGINYGTRCSTVVMLGNGYSHYVIEKTWNSKGEEEDHVNLVF